MGRPGRPVELKLRLGHVGSPKGSTGTAQLHGVAGEGRRFSQEEYAGRLRRIEACIRIDVIHGHTRNMTASLKWMSCGLIFLCVKLPTHTSRQERGRANRNLPNFFRIGNHQAWRTRRLRLSVLGHSIPGGETVARSGTRLTEDVDHQPPPVSVLDRPSGRHMRERAGEQEPYVASLVGHPSPHHRIDSHRPQGIRTRSRPRGSEVWCYRGSDSIS